MSSGTTSPRRRAAIRGRPPVPRAEPRTGVRHRVADVHGPLRRGLDDGGPMRATFPPGACTAAPGIRATEIIHCLQPPARDVCTRATGCISPVAGTAPDAAIRTFELPGSRVRQGLGGDLGQGRAPAESRGRPARCRNGSGAGGGPLGSRGACPGNCADSAGRSVGARLAGHRRSHRASRVRERSRPLAPQEYK
ncbi:chorismate-binding protein [Kocuria sp. U4B]